MIAEQPRIKTVRAQGFNPLVSKVVDYLSRGRSYPATTLQIREDLNWDRNLDSVLIQLRADGIIDIWRVARWDEEHAQAVYVLRRSRNPRHFSTERLQRCPPADLRLLQFVPCEASEE